jgi:hypothetical protein
MLYVWPGSQALSFICLTVNSLNFPVRNRGAVMGILLAFYATSAIVWTLVYALVITTSIVITIFANR